MLKNHSLESVIGIVFNESGGVLLVKRRDVPVWVLPGGGVDPGESLESAVIREIQEETGLTVAVSRKVGEYTPINRLSYKTFSFECSIQSGSLTSGSETKDVGFFSLDHLPKEFFFLHREWLFDSFVKTVTTIQKPIDSVTYFNLLKYFLKHPALVLRFLYTCLKVRSW